MLCVKQKHLCYLLFYDCPVSQMFTQQDILFCCMIIIYFATLHIMIQNIIK